MSTPSPCTKVLVLDSTLPPDNIAPAVAACLGDLVTLSLLGIIAEAHLSILDTPVPIIIVVLLALSAIGWTYITNRNENVRHLLTEGWSPLFIAMAISTGTGIVLDTFVERYSGFALLAVVIAGTSPLSHEHQSASPSARSLGSRPITFRPAGSAPCASTNLVISS